MQPRGVIVSAILLAIILAGVLWFSVTRNSEEVVLETPTPTPIITLPEAATPEPGVVGSQTTAAPTTPVDAVPPTANTGPAEVAIALLTLSAVIGSAGLYHTLRS